MVSLIILYIIYGFYLKITIANYNIFLGRPLKDNTPTSFFNHMAYYPHFLIKSE